MHLVTLETPAGAGGSPDKQLEKDSSVSIIVPAAAPNTTFGASAVGSFHTEPRVDDPYCYQTGFGNRFASESMSVSSHVEFLLGHII